MIVVGKKVFWLACLVLMVGFLAPATSRAGWFHDKDCQPSSYSRFHILTPQLWRLRAHHGPKVELYAPLVHPEVPNSYQVLPYPCPYAYPREIPYGVPNISR
jgi:hypothetical protein